MESNPIRKLHSDFFASEQQKQTAETKNNRTQYIKAVDLLEINKKSADMSLYCNIGVV